VRASPLRYEVKASSLISSSPWRS